MTSQQQLSHEQLLEERVEEQSGVEAQSWRATRRNTDRQEGFDKAESGSRAFHARGGVLQQRAKATAEYLPLQHLEKAPLLGCSGFIVHAEPEVPPHF